MTHQHFVLALRATTQGFVALILIMVPLLVVAALSTGPDLQPRAPVPSPALDPVQVVRIQVEALRHNSPLNEGIELTYRFASTGNKSFTGPLARFIEMLRAAPYERLLNHRSARYSAMAISADRAHQIVTITDRNGEDIRYHWVLTRQVEGEFKDCWMTSAVIAAEPPLQREFVNMRRGDSLPEGDP
jgi:hypothetical protein